jgi:large subunit ribosomal protein L32
MAVPKKKTSVSKKGLRRAGQHHKLYRKHPMNCPNCGDMTMPNKACPSFHNQSKRRRNRS